MKRKTITLIILTLAPLFCGIFQSYGKEDSDKQQLVFEKFSKPWMNDSQFLKVNGYATIDVAFLFNDQGYVEDWVALRANDPKLIRSLNSVVGDWKIKPPMYEGKPSWAYMEFTVRFVNEGAVVSMSPIETLMSMTGSMNDDFIYLVPFSELDSIPTPIEMDQPKLSPKLVQGSPGATVKFEFFIDQEGKVRMPIVKEFETEEMAAAIMLESLLKWRFEPPTRKGRPVMTRAVVPFVIP